MVGLFINTLPVRARVSPEEPTLAWLKSFQDQLAELRQYEYSPLIEVQRLSDAPRDQPLFESLLAFQNYPVDGALREPQGSLTLVNMRGFERTNFPLSIIVVPREELSIWVSYDPRRFDAAAIGRTLGHYRTLLEGIVADPDRRLAELPPLTEAERQQVLMEWNQTEAYFPEDRCLHELFEEQVERTPDAIAAVFEDQRLTYRELNERANQLARRLQKVGAGPEMLVGLCVERSLEMVVGMLGILKAGAAYLPLDLVYPEERIAFILDDAQIKIIVAQKHLFGLLPITAQGIAVLDSHSPEFERRRDRKLRAYGQGG
jgi:surfactin family lipopeptide synthetase C